MNLISILLIISIFLAITITAFLARWIPYRDRKAMMINLGFSEFKYPGSYIYNKIKQLLNTSIRKKNIFCMKGEGALFLFIYDHLPSFSDRIEKFMLTVISDKLILPMFTLTPKLNVTDRLDSIMSDTMDQLAVLEAGDKKLHKINISVSPEFNKRFILLGKDIKSINKVFTIYKSKQLLQIKDGFEINADSDLFTLKINFDKPGNIGNENKIRRSIALARKIYRILKN